MDKKKVLINSIVVFLLFIPLHFMYEKTNLDIVVPFVPVNESIWEHLKLFLSANLIYCVFIQKDNYFVNVVCHSILESVIFLILFIPIYCMFGENIIITLFLLFISILVSNILLSQINLCKKKICIIISIIFIIINLIIFTYFSYNPLKIELFKDPISNTYGINKTS